MHDVDRTLREFENTEMEFETFEAETGENEQFLGSVLGGMLGGDTQSGEAFEAQEQGFLGESGEFESQGFLGETSNEAVFDEVQEMELAAELLEVSNEAELEYFLGNLIKKAGRAVGGFVKGPIGQALGSALKSVAKKALPLAGAALGNMVVPGLGGMIGGKLASAAGNMFGLELEGLSPQDREFEVARRFVRLAGSAAQRAARTPQRVAPGRAARLAIAGAARRHAPGLLQPRASYGRSYGPQAPIFRGLGRAASTSAPSYGLAPSFVTPSYSGNGDGDGIYGTGSYPASYGHTGRWYRRGRKIVLVGA